MALTAMAIATLLVLFSMVGLAGLFTLSAHRRLERSRQRFIDTLRIARGTQRRGTSNAGFNSNPDIHAEALRRYSRRALRSVPKG